MTDGDAGVPTMIARPHGPSAAAFDAIARAVAAALGWPHVPDTVSGGA